MIRSRDLNCSLKETGTDLHYLALSTELKRASCHLLSWVTLCKEVKSYRSWQLGVVGVLVTYG